MNESTLPAGEPTVTTPGQHTGGHTNGARPAIGPDLELAEVLRAQRSAFLAEGPPPVEVRVERINRLLHGIATFTDELAGALNDDFGQRDPTHSLATDLLATISVLRHSRRNVARWMRPEGRTNAALALMGARATIQWEPVGVVGIISPWNFPVTLSLQPAGQAFAAGNRVMLKPSEFTPATAEVMRAMFEDYFSPDEAYVATGGVDVADAFSHLPFDHLFFTGASEIGRKVMQAAAEHLVPVTLELGGKSPVVAGEDADTNRVAGAMAFGKTLNAGQFCVAPDYLFTPRGTEDAVTAAAGAAVRTAYARTSPRLTSIINDRHYERLERYLDDARDKGARIVPLLDGVADPVKRQMPPTLVFDTDDSMLIAHEEVFGPLLSVLAYDDVDEVITHINQRPQPLAAYWFGGDTPARRRFLDRVIAGGVTVNDIMWHVGVESLPFGGVGNSGMGTYHGRAGFETFSHGKPVVRAPRFGGTRLASGPYPERIEAILRAAVKRSKPRLKDR